MTSPHPATFAVAMTDHDDLARRLSGLGDQPVPEDVRARHLHAMRQAVDVSRSTPPLRRPFGRAVVAAAALAGFLVGSTGFAMAGALPGPVQGVAHDVLSVVQVDVPDWRNRGECVSAAARVGDEAAKAACPKGGPPDGTAGRDRTAGPDGASGTKGKPAKPAKPDEADGPNRDDDPCTGKPPWAGRRTAEEKAAAKATCPDRADDEHGAPDDDGVATDDVAPPGTGAEEPAGS